MERMISDYDTLERHLRDMRTVLTCIALQQEDLTLSVPFTALEEVPKGTELEVSVDRLHKNFVFKAILPPEMDDQQDGSRANNDPLPPPG
jgi:SAM-dependent MidA family methyltransferase